MKKICLISLPWQEPFSPSPALGALAAFIKRNNEAIQVDCRHDHLRLADRIGRDYYSVLTDGSTIANFTDVFSFPFLYPEKAESCVKAIARMIRSPLFDRAASEDGFRSEATHRIKDMTADELAGAHGILPRRSLDPRPENGLLELTEMIVWSIMVRIAVYIENLAREIAGKYDLVGLTTSYNQLATSLLLCDKLKRISPTTVTVLGGILVSGRAGPSMIKEYDFIDFIIQGEGEYPLSALIDYLGAKDFEAIEHTPGILTRNKAIDHEEGVELWQVDNLDDLPFPDYDDYARLIGKRGWILPVEGSRGCWWNRCHYCNFNNQWEGYRVKSNPRFAAEIEYLCAEYGTSTVKLLDNIHNPRGIQSFAQVLKDTDTDFSFYYEMRANLSPYEVLVLYEAGMSYGQVGIEGLSNSFLNRIRKGTKVIQNLQIMKTLYELGIETGSNLIVNYPRSTQEEVEETCLAIRKYAYAYRPLGLSYYGHKIGSPADRERDAGAIKNVRNADRFRDAIPEAVLERIELYYKSYDPVESQVSWSAVFKAVEWWEKVQRYYLATGTWPMYYQTHESSLIIHYLHFGKRSELHLHDVERELYLYCTKIRSKRRILEKFSGRMSAEAINNCLEKWTAEVIMYADKAWGEKFLSLAPAMEPDHAARRIRKMAHEDGEIRAA